MTVRINIFNTYYFSFLKKVKDIARELKHAQLGKDPEATYTKILKAIKTHYATYDSTSDKYHSRFVATEDSLPECTFFQLWSSEVTNPSSLEKWLESEDVQNVAVYEDITVKHIMELVTKKQQLYYNLAILYIFSQDISDEQLTLIVQLIKNIKDTEAFNKDILSVESETIKTTLMIIQVVHVDALSSTIDDSFKELEETSLGKLAKEIMSDINLDEMQDLLNGESDILKSLGNPNGGLGKLLGSVSQKMMSKLASGEIKQESLFEDAMKFSSQMKNIVPPSGDGPDVGGMGNLGVMFEQIQKMASTMGGAGAGGGGLGNLQEMMSAFGMGGGDNELRPNIGAPGSGHGRPQIENKSSLNRSIQAKQLRKKLQQKKLQQQDKSSKENV